MKQKQILIQGEEFTLNTIPATKSLKIFKDILKLVGPSFAELNKEKAAGIKVFPSDNPKVSILKPLTNLCVE